MGWLFDVLGISVDGFVSSIFNGIINWIYEVIFSVIKVVFTKINETGSDLFRLPWVQSLVTGYLQKDVLLPELMNCIYFLTI